LGFFEQISYPIHVHDICASGIPIRESYGKGVYLKTETHSLDSKLIVIIIDPASRRFENRLNNISLPQASSLACSEISITIVRGKRNYHSASFNKGSKEYEL